jgi:hypothetical protein
MLTRNRLRELFDYDQETGELARKVPTGRPRKGSKARYRRHNVDGVDYYEHRLVWLYVYGDWPTKDIDHINGDRYDNRIDNLREVTVAQNHMNRRAKSFLKGVTWDKRKRKWQAQIMLNKKQGFLGYFDCPAAAHMAYQIAADEKFGAFARRA